jgi:hypothetical protein
LIEAGFRNRLTAMLEPARAANGGPEPVSCHGALLVVRPESRWFEAASWRNRRTIEVGWHIPVLRALIRINTKNAACGNAPPTMGNVIFKCPRTGMNVQHWLADEKPSAHAATSYETVTCNACSGFHFINRTTGKLLGENED